MKKATPCLLFVLLLMLAACSPIPPTPFESPVVPTTTASVVVATSTVAMVPSPAISPISPTPLASNAPLAPHFKLNPLTVDSTEATGQGPVGFTLVIVDATSGAKVLGKGEPDAKGDFRIPLTPPLRQGHVIGLTVDLTPDQLASDVLMHQLFDARGPGFRLIPQVVTIYDGYEVP
jgi:hypothetical protein